MKRVLQLIGSFNQGGSERQAVALSQRLKTAGEFDVHVATLDQSGPLLADIEYAGFGEIPEFPLTSFYNANFVRQVHSFANYLSDNKIALLHTHDFYTNVFGMAAAALAGTRAKVASKRETGGMRSRAQDMIERIALGRADSIVVNSLAVRDHLSGRGITPAKLNLIYNGVDLSRFTSPDGEDFRSTTNLPKDVPLITLVANLRHEVKNIPMLMRAVTRVRNAHFVIAGEGNLESDLKALASTLGVADRTHFIGPCADIPGLLAASFACVLTSTNEGFSNSILEYMAAGKPVVATRVGGAAEAIVEGETGYLVESDDDLSLAQKLNELLSDQSHAAAMGQKGQGVVAATFSDQAQLSRTSAMYNSLLER